MRFLITGGCGFIGKHFIKLLLANNHTVINIDKLTYASDLDQASVFDKDTNYLGIYKDIHELNTLHVVDWVVHFAAESHVDNSIDGSEKFISTNIGGTQHLLELIRNKPIYDRPSLLHISTDEVYGDITSGVFTETALLNPSNPYSASKAAAEHLVTAWARTYGIEYLMVRPSNNYGCAQYYEKLIPRSMNRLQYGKSIIIHGDGSYIRTWTHVEDTCRAILHLINLKQMNTVFNISSGFELTNLEVATKIAVLFPVEDPISFVANRHGQDIRYAINSDKLIATGFKFTKDFDSALIEIKNCNTHWRSY